MARPKKSGIDYFSLDTNITEQDFVFLLEENCGLEGFAIFIKLLCKIYEEEGYFIEWNEKKMSIFSRKIGATSEKVAQVIEICLQEKIFSREKYDTFGVLTSRGIQKRYLEATKKRVGIEISKDFSCLKEKVSSTFQEEETLKKEEETQKKEEESTQSKVKESKVNKIPPNPPKGGDEEKVKFFKEFAKWLSHFEYVGNPNSYARQLLSKYPLKISKQAFKDQICTSPSKFREMADHLLSLNPQN